MVLGPRHNGLMPHRSRWPLAAGLAAGVTLDALLGDPRRGHPVAAFGRAAAALEARDYADSRPRGAAHAAACVLAVAAPAALLARRTRGRPPYDIAAAALATWAVTGARSLHHEAERTRVALAAHDLRTARLALPSLCGRDPANLDAGEIARAVIESVAENTSDAVVAPLLWGAAAGWPGLLAYRAVNTLDAMVGYRSPRYLRFGWASARLDDVANWVPARVTAALTIACAPLIPVKLAPGPVDPEWPVAPPPAASAQSPPAKGRLGNGPAASAWRAVSRYGNCHPSPNAGRCEAAFAGALGLRLGGTNVYGGIAETRPGLGEGRAPEPDDIRRAIRLSRAVTVSATALAVLLALVRPSGRLRDQVRRTKAPISHITSAAMATHHSTCRAKPAPAMIRMISRASSISSIFPASF